MAYERRLETGLQWSDPVDDGGWYQFSGGRLQVSENETAKNSSKGWLFLRDGKAVCLIADWIANEKWDLLGG